MSSILPSSPSGSSKARLVGRNGAGPRTRRAGASFVIGAKIDPFGGLSFVIRGIPSSIRPPISSFRRRPESRGAGRGNVARSKTSRGEGLVPRWGRGGANPTNNQRNPGSPFHLLMRLWQGHLRFRRRPESLRDRDGKCSAVEDYARRGACPPLPADRGGWLVPKHVPATDPPPEFSCRHPNLMDPLCSWSVANFGTTEAYPSVRIVKANRRNGLM